MFYGGQELAKTVSEDSSRLGLSNNLVRHEAAHCQLLMIIDASAFGKPAAMMKWTLSVCAVNQLLCT